MQKQSKNWPGVQYPLNATVTYSAAERTVIHKQNSFESTSRAGFKVEPQRIFD